MNLRRLATLALGAVLAFSLVPATAAFAQDDLVCLKEDTRQETRRTAEGWETVVVGYCAKWWWSGGTPTGPKDPATPGEDDPDGGKGGTPDDPKADCDALKAQLRDALEQRDIYNKEIDLAASELARLTAIVANDYAYRDITRRIWVDAQRRTNDLLNQYIAENDLETEYVYSPKAGVEITRQRTEYNIDTSTPTGQALEDAIDAEFVAKGDHYIADETWREHEAQRAGVQVSLEDLQRRLSALGLAIEALQAQLGTNCQ
jgi:hypothetical protein